MAARDTSFFGVRHHGPGSAAALVAALDALRPVAVLIEGPADAGDLAPRLADPDMRPPVALLAYPQDDPAATRFWPFAEFSPEYQAALWAARNKAALRFIDLPATALGEASPQGEQETAAPPPSRPADPIAALARAAGYEDGESWWADLIEQNPAPGEIFAALAQAVSALREDEGELDPLEARREAHMRIEIGEAERVFDGPIAVVCGAWHVPALARRVAKKADQALLKGLPRRKAAITFAPWTSPRLALGLGYGAGVAAPGWNAHLWRARDRKDARSLWLARIARALREKGHFVSTAALIEAERLAAALAALRGRPAAGFEELREAAVATMFDGETLRWRLIEDELLLGRDVGAIPADVPLAPLIEDLQRAQRETRLKPEALDRELTLDLRSDAGLARSTLLHRLAALGVDWGRPLDAGRSRGTFRERWTLRWEPDFAVRLVENLIYGPTLARAADGKLVAEAAKATTLAELAGLVRRAVTADLPQAAAAGVAALERRAALSSECAAMLAAIPPLADVARYGQARRVDASRLGDLLEKLIVEAALGLPRAARGLDQDAAAALDAALREADAGVRLIEADAALAQSWRDGLAATLDDDDATPRVAGAAMRLLYEAEALDAAQAAARLARRLSPGTPVADAAGFFEGFFAAAAARLIHDAALRAAVDGWLCGLEEDDFVACLPLLRRVLSTLDRMERARLIEAALGHGGARATSLRLVEDGERWARHFEALRALLQTSASEGASHG